MDTLRGISKHTLARAVLVLLALLLWLLFRGYAGVAGDAQLYAFQALARIHENLSNDLYLQNTSQDNYTVFSPLYAAAIRLLGLERAALVSTLIFSAWFWIAAWCLAAAMLDRRSAWPALALLLIVATSFGASEVFAVPDAYFTARLPAEALVLTALACQLRGFGVASLAAILLALALHPLMALPGLLALIILRLPFRWSLAAAALSVVGIALTAVAASTAALSVHGLRLMDWDWLDVVQERAQFLFLQLWAPKDWSTNVRPLLYLVMALAVLPSPPVIAMCRTALLTACGGIAVALVASFIGPVAILIQGQAWRWVWIGCIVGPLLLPSVALALWRSGASGRLVAVLLGASCLVPNVWAGVCVLAGLAVWMSRDRLPADAGPYLRWTAFAVAGAVAIWLTRQCAISVIAFVKSESQVSVANLRGLGALQAGAFALFIAVWCDLDKDRTLLITAPACAVELLLLFVLVSSSFKTARFAFSSDPSEFAVWLKAIPSDATVLVTPPRDVGSFVWFTLERPNYLSLDQSAGVVFSRETAVEIRRRSQVLLPLMDPDWKIRSKNRRLTGGGKATPVRALTVEILARICADPRLAFVLSPQNLGLPSILHAQEGRWKNWRLYDCAAIR